MNIKKLQEVDTNGKQISAHYRAVPYHAVIRNRNTADMESLSPFCLQQLQMPFDEQVLIYAQKPEATAVLEMEKWNTLFGRWVNKGATGIAVFEEKTAGAV